jgi:hypothetical protein
MVEVVKHHFEVMVEDDMETMVDTINNKKVNPIVVNISWDDT